VVAEARKLKPGQAVLLFQPRREVEPAGSLLRATSTSCAWGAIEQRAGG
jgi:hypothetical protein